MAATESVRLLRLISVATFRATTFLVGLALWLHLRGGLSGFLGHLDTSSGLLAFVAFWTTTCIASRIGFSSLDRNPDERETTAGMWAATTVAGCWNGAFVFLAGFSIVIFGTVVQRGLYGAIFGVLFAALLGSLVAFAFGGIFGAIYGIVETLLVWLASAILVGRAPQRQ